MPRLLPRLSRLLALVLAVSLGASTLAFADTGDAAPTPKKKPAVTRHIKRHVTRYTVPPGYRSPQQIDRQEYEAWRRDRGFAWRHNAPIITITGRRFITAASAATAATAGTSARAGRRRRSARCGIAGCSGT
jgi:hypothetical protein